jgi:Peptidase M50B-like
MKTGRFLQLTLIASILCLSWLGMMIVHELGHVLAAWVSGERVFKVVLHPLTISRTDTSHENHPLLVIWGGALLGCFIPLFAWALVKACRLRFVYLFQFFTGFCLIANGCYLGVGTFFDVGDAGDLARYGCPRWLMLLYGLVCVPTGLFLWNGLGPHFGLGEAQGKVDRKAVLVTLALVLIVVVVEGTAAAPSTGSPKPER